MTEILDFKNCEDAGELDIESIAKNITNVDENIAFDFLEGVDLYIAHLQTVVRLFSAFKCPHRIRQLLSDKDLHNWQVQDISAIAEKISNKPYIADSAIDEVIAIILNCEKAIKKDVAKCEKSN